jgi:hypothetical protein
MDESVLEGQHYLLTSVDQLLSHARGNSIWYLSCPLAWPAAPWR